MYHRLEAFLGIPDTPEFRGKFRGNVSFGRMFETTEFANLEVSLGRDEAQFILSIYPNYISRVYIPRINPEIDGGRAI